MTLRTQYGYAESSNIKATSCGHIFDVLQEGAALENGMLKKLGELDSILETRKVTNATDKDKVVLVLSALVQYDTSISLYNHDSYLRKEDGEIARAYEIIEEDRFAVADYMISAIGDTPVVGNLVVINKDTGFYKEVAATAETTTLTNYGFVGVIETISDKDSLSLVRIRVKQNLQK